MGDKPMSEEVLDARDQGLKIIGRTIDENAAEIFADWNDLGELTFRFKGRTFRGIFYDITDEED
jgi:hypothetical protein